VSIAAAQARKQMRTRYEPALFFIRAYDTPILVARMLVE
jgi:hypothetical protein